MLQALSASQQNEWIRRNWWDKWYSWLFVGGPPGRWIVGTVLGVRDLQVRESAARAQEIGYHPGDKVAFVGVGLLATFGFAVLLSLVASVSESNRPDMGYILASSMLKFNHIALFSQTMAVISIRNISLGRTTYESYIPTKPTQILETSEKKSKGHENFRYVCIPGTLRGGDKMIAPVLPDEKLYDLGFWRNWGEFFRTSSFIPFLSTNNGSKRCVTINGNFPSILI